jgi:hypothetical protein
MDTLFIGYTTSFQSASDWRLAFRQSTPMRKGGVVRRTAWEHEQDPNRRLIVDANEYLNPADLEHALERWVREAGVRYEPGPASLGPGSLVHPRDKAWSIFVTRANLLIWGVSNGHTKLDVEPLLRPFISELDAVRPGDLDEHLSFSRETGSHNGGVILSVKPERQLGEWAWMKFHATGGSLERHSEPNRIVVHPTAPATATVVTGWVIEPGRPTYMGRYTLP